VSEMTWTTFHIGGPLPHDLQDEFDEIVENGYWEDPDDVEEAIAKGRSFCLSGEANYGNDEELESFCQENGLTYWKHWDGKSGVFDGGIEIWKPGMEKEETCACSDDGGDPHISIGELRTAEQAGKSIGDLIAELDKFSMDAVPALTLAPAKNPCDLIGA
jgi:hypothetical protein